MSELIPASPALPTLSETLSQWLERETVPRGTVLTEDQLHELWKDFDNCQNGKMALRVRQGLRLAQIRAASERDYEAGLVARNIPLSNARKLIDLYELFDALPKLELLDKATDLGASRIRELKVEMGIEGLCRLIGGEPVKGLRYETAAHLSHREIIAWRKQLEEDRSTKRLQAHGLERMPPVPNEPHALTLAREEVLAAVHRAQLELERAQTMVDALLPRNDDDWKPTRLEVAHAADTVLRAIAEQTEGLRGLLQKRFGVAVLRPLNGTEYRTIASSALDASRDAAQAAAEQELEARARVRQTAWKQRGAPPKTLATAIDQALKTDQSASDLDG